MNTNTHGHEHKLKLELKLKHKHKHKHKHEHEHKRKHSASGRESGQLEPTGSKTTALKRKGSGKAEGRFRTLAYACIQSN